MERTITDVDTWRAYWGGVVAATMAIVVAAIAFPRTVYDGFLWRYFWGPVVADGHNAPCAERTDGETIVHMTTLACQEATGIVATPGYTTLSTIVYALVLLVAAIGIYLGSERAAIGTEPRLFFALLPFIFLGGTLRALEDAMLAVPAGADAVVPTFPATALLISPFIYFSVFVVAIAALLVGLWMTDRGLVSGYEYPLAALGTALLFLALAYLIYLTTVIDVTFVPLLIVLVIGGATLVTLLVWVAIDWFAPEINAGTGYTGAVIIWGHAVDGFANVLSLDWADTLGLGMEYGPKHVANALIADVTEAIQPPALTEAIGSVWPFIPVKILVAVFVVYLFDDELLEESPRFSLLMLIAVLAVGLGPGTRDLLRAALGI